MKVINKINKKKSQIIVYDFLFGFVCFMIIIALVATMWFRTSANAQYRAIEEEKLNIANNIANMLIHTSGTPSNWEYYEEIYKESNFSIGLAIDNNVLSEKKVDIFFKMNNSDYRGYKETKELLRLANYDYYIILRNSTSNLITHRTGQDPNENLSVATTRKVIIENEPKTIEIIIY